MKLYREIAVCLIQIWRCRSLLNKQEHWLARCICASLSQLALYVCCQTTLPASEIGHHSINIEILNGKKI